MKVIPIKTQIVISNDDLLAIISHSISEIPERSVLVITSKIVSFCQNRLIVKNREKYDLVRKEADFYLEPHSSKYQMMLTIKNHTLAVNAGIDESNADDHLVLWPENIQEVSNRIWRFLRQHYGVKKVGVVITDSRTIPLRWGVIGTCLAHTGFKAVNDRRGEKDLFGREIKMTQVNVAEAIAVAAVLEMGEVAEQTPLCLVTEIKKIEFQDREPTKKELKALIIEPEDDVYAPLLTSVKWKRKK